MTANSFDKTNASPFWLVLAGIAFLIVGILAIFHPMVTALATGIVLAAAFLVAGFSSVTAALSGSGVHGRGMLLLFGVFAIVTGALLAFFPLEGSVSLVWLVGAFYAANGVMELLNGFRAKNHRGLKIVLGIVDIVIGLYVLFLLPAGALEVLALLVGIGLIFRAITMFMLASMLRKANSIPKA